MYEIKYISNSNGDKTDVLMPYGDYLDLLEELEDLKTIIERKDEAVIEHQDVINLLHINE